MARPEASIEPGERPGLGGTVGASHRGNRSLASWDSLTKVVIPHPAELDLALWDEAVRKFLAVSHHYLLSPPLAAVPEDDPDAGGNRTRSRLLRSERFTASKPLRRPVRA